MKVEKDHPLHHILAETEIEVQETLQQCLPGLKIDSSFPDTKWTLYAWHRRRWQASRVFLTWGGTKVTYKACKLLYAS